MINSKQGTCIGEICKFAWIPVGLYLFEKYLHARFCWVKRPTFIGSSCLTRLPPACDAGPWEPQLKQLMLLADLTRDQPSFNNWGDPKAKKTLAQQWRGLFGKIYIISLKFLIFNDLCTSCSRLHHRVSSCFIMIDLLGWNEQNTDNEHCLCKRSVGSAFESWTEVGTPGTESGDNMKIVKQAPDWWVFAHNHPFINGLSIINYYKPSIFKGYSHDYGNHHMFHLFLEENLPKLERFRRRLKPSTWWRRRSREHGPVEGHMCFRSPSKALGVHQPKWDVYGCLIWSNL